MPERAAVRAPSIYSGPRPRVTAVSLGAGIVSILGFENIPCIAIERGTEWLHSGNAIQPVARHGPGEA